MAINANVYSGKEFTVYIANDDTSGKVGTFNSTTGGEWKKLDIETFSFPNFNPVQEFEMRTGTGRVADLDNVYTSDEGVVRSIELNGRLDANSLEILLSSVTGLEKGTGDSSTGEIAIQYDHSPATLQTGTTAISSGDFYKTLSLYFVNPSDISGENIKMNGCVCTAFSISADMGTASGRFNYTATLETGFSPTKGTVAISPVPSASSTFYFMKDWTYRHLYDANNVTLFTPLLESFGLNFASSAKFLGRGTSPVAGDPEVIGRSLPELEITYSMKMKYDDESAALVDAYRQTNQDVEIYMATASETDDTFPSGLTSLAVDINHSKLSNVSFDAGDVASLSVEGKVLSKDTDEVCVINID